MYVQYYSRDLSKNELLFNPPFGPDPSYYKHQGHVLMDNDYTILLNPKHLVLPVSLFRYPLMRDYVVPFGILVF